MILNEELAQSLSKGKLYDYFNQQFVNTDELNEKDLISIIKSQEYVVFKMLGKDKEKMAQYNIEVMKDLYSSSAIFDKKR